MHSTSEIVISRKALETNLRFIRAQLTDNVEFCSVVKGNAYGHGIELFVPLAESLGVRQFAVFSADEAKEVLKNRMSDSEIMIMGDIEDDDIPWAIENGISFYIFDMERLDAALVGAKKLRIPAKIHLELETGMHRTGLEMGALELVLARLKKKPDLWRMEGICTHLAGAESVTNHLRIQNQIKKFEDIVEWIRGKGFNSGRLHIASSAATLLYPDTHLDMVRVGIAQYGYWPTVETKMHFLLEKGGESALHMKDPLRRIIRWTSKVMSIKEVAPGEFVNYGNAYLTTRRQKVAVVPVGYFHGFTRSLSNVGQVLIHGKRCQVVGTVNMNMMVVDVTDLNGVLKGYEVVIIGKQKKMEISVASFAELTPFLNYEVLVGLPSEIPRRVEN